MPRAFRRAALFAYSRLDLNLGRALVASRSLMSGFFAESVPFSEQGSFIVEAYHAAYEGPTGLFFWEEPWFMRRLPPAPARILVGAAGAGREAIALRERGYTIDALEPTPRLADACRAALGDWLVVTCTYEDLSRAVLDDGGGPASAFRDRRYDAVILGWGSLSHVLEPSKRARLLGAAGRLCPKGPVLASFLMQPEEGRALRFGRRVGRMVFRSRNPSGQYFTSRYGFAHRFRREEIDALGCEVGRAVAWDSDEATPGANPHVTFLP